MFKEKEYSVCVPKKPSNYYWIDKNADYIELSKSKNVNVLLIGDSMIEYLNDTSLWSDYFKPLNSINFGIAAEGIENLLYRVENEALDYIKAKVVVYLIGTNNIISENCNRKDIADANFKIAKTIRSKQPDAYIIALGIPPKGHRPNFTREIIEDINKRIESSIMNSGDEKMKYLCCHENFINKNDGTIDHKDYTDWLHFSEAGYKKFCKPLLELLNTILNNNN